MTSEAAGRTAGASAIVLPTLAAGQFLMTLDSSVMNVSIAQVAEDVGTTVTGVQTAITLYTLVMATMMITGGKIGTMMGRRRAFALGCVIYGAGSLTTAFAPNLGILILGWSVLEGLGAALIMPAIVALVAANFAPAERPRAYGLVASAGAIAVAAGPLIGGAATTYWTWRVVFAGEVVVVLAILVLARKMQDTAPARRAPLDVTGVVLSSAGLGLAVFGVLRSSEWGWIQAKPGAPTIGGVSATLWLIVVGLLVLRVFFWWQNRRAERGKEPLVDVTLLRNSRLTGGLVMFLFQFLLQAGLFFTIPLYLSVALGLSAFETGVRLLPLSVALLVAAVAIPKLRPNASPRRVVALGLGALLGGIVALILALDLGAGPEIVTAPLLLAGLGVGALSSQLGAVTVSSVPDRLSGDVGGLQNTATNLGASLGTALAGSALIGALTTSFLLGIEDNPAVPDDMVSTATVQLAGGVPFLSDVQVRTGLTEAGLPAAQVDAIVESNAAARVDGLRTSLAVLAVLASVAIFLTRLLPTRPAGDRG
ncbi:MFS transporter [Myceligenerans xiligouense]|uniref:MFS transporter n=1 Tax=Myceligenerans xiligouense TaxID=253184 RepID=A0A3N4ZNL0_9MICO|nr:MFS transporter [Myceligenerans xiligouense]RPF22525.1 MFS transporter [Myceligenerans xiligouense]